MLWGIGADLSCFAATDNQRPAGDLVVVFTHPLRQLAIAVPAIPAQ